ncbi:hypothetical protein [Kineosporia sp. R_H_3]|uniref:pPIWI-associating nuclease domain-containing protein n=1 Tax=Kineosporia sp. R_H_3 TaxID=1961848 RepID=UPI000B4ADC5A|nr:hypothetical protein [Kineosporia sp. R_H_3]
MADQLDADLLRRLQEFQFSVRRQVSSPVEPVVHARGPLSEREAGILDRLHKLSPKLAASMEQALRDLNDTTRLSYMGPAGEVREVMRAATQQLAPDEDIRKQTWYLGIKQGDKINPSQSERIRYAVQQKGGNRDQVKGVDDMIDELIGQIGRRTYQSGSKSLHAGATRAQVSKLVGWVFAILDEVLPEA